MTPILTIFPSLFDTKKLTTSIAHFDPNFRALTFVFGFHRGVHQLSIALSRLHQHRDDTVGTPDSGATWTPSSTPLRSSQVRVLDTA
jgi:hypothetical protein